MALTFAPIGPWQWVSTFLTLLFFGYLGWAVAKGRWRQWGGKRITRAWVLALTLLSTISLVIAVWNPQRISPVEGQSIQLAVILDVSQSVQRGPTGLTQARKEAEALVSEWIRNLPADMKRQGTAGIFTLQGDVSLTAPRHPMAELPSRLKRLDPNRFAAGNGTDLAAALRRAEGWLDPEMGQGVCLLVSDGHQTQGDALAAVEGLALRGIPLHVLPVMGGGQDLDWVAADLPDQLSANAGTHLRAILHNSMAEESHAQITLTLNGAAGGLEEAAQGSSEKIMVEANGWRRLRWPLKFRGTGLQYVDLSLQGQAPEPRQRRFFSFVQQPPRILLVGGDFRVAKAFPAETVVVDLVDPDQVLDGLRANHYDSVVLSGVTATSLGTEAMAQIAWLVEKEGLGLFLINGSHRGLGEEDQTVLMSYNDTVLEPLLPLSSRPRPYQPEAPGRQVVVLLDASGSMGGWRLDKSQEIVSYIIENLLRPRDRLYLITFSTGARILVENRYMDQPGKNEALAALWAIQTGGGTDPSFALELLDKRRLQNCGLIFITDGEFDQVAYRPDCRATVFAIGRDEVPRSSALWAIADPFPVTQGFSPAAIKMPFFEQETRNRFYEPGSFVPMSMDLFLSRSDRLSVPDLPLAGSAVAFTKDEATLIAVRPKLTDPILAYASRGFGEVGVFTSTASSAWLDSPKGRDALAAWMLRTIGFTDRDRYRLRVRDLGNQLELEVGLLAKNGKVPRITQLSGSLVTGELPEMAVTFEADAGEPGLFRGKIRLQDVTSPMRAKLLLRESGAEALSRPQAIPVFLPPVGDPPGLALSEKYSFGTHTDLLNQLAARTGGQFPPNKNTPIFPLTPNRKPPKPLWPYLLLLAGMTHLGAVTLQRFSA